MLYTIASYKTKEEDKMDNIKVNFDNVDVTEKNIMKYAEEVEKVHDELHKKANNPKEFLGWMELPTKYDKKEFEKIKKSAKKIQENSEILVVIGIGGSYLGARAVIEALTHTFYAYLPKEQRKTPQILYVGNNLNPNYINDIIDLIGNRDFSINVISKSGTTTEPAIAFRIFREILENKYGLKEAQKRIYVTTDKKNGALKQLADSEKYTTFVIPDNIGGRYSVLTDVCLLPIAVAGIDLEIKSGEIFGLLGPNGAGKTTTVRILTLLSKKKSGSVKICGYDIEKDSERIKELIGVVPQHMSLDQDLTGRENLVLQARLHHLKNKAAMEQRINEILEFVELTDRADDKSRRYSGGMKRRLMIGMALLHKPKMLFLDEPTVGLDPQVRRKMWDLIRKMNEAGMTVLLTTHYIEEADQLCRRVAIMNRGRIIAVDTPQKLKEKVGRVVVEHMEADGMINNFFDNREQAASYVAGLDSNATVREANLEDVFIELTGRRVND